MLEQRPAQSLDARISALFDPPHLIDGGRGVGNGKCSVTPLMKAGDMSMLAAAIWSAVALCPARCWAKRGLF